MCISVRTILAGTFLLLIYDFHYQYIVHFYSLDQQIIRVHINSVATAFFTYESGFWTSGQIVELSKIQLHWRIWSDLVSYRLANEM